MDNLAAQELMQKLVTGMSANKKKIVSDKGFTLIELLIVLIIIGITVGFALIAFGDFGASRRIVLTMEQFANTLELAKQQAILEGSTLGLRVDHNSYQLFKFQAPAQWVSLANQTVFKKHYFPDHAFIQFKSSRLLSISSAPNVIINSSGEISPFTLTAGSSKNKPLTVLVVNSDGKINFNQPNVQ